MKVQARLSQVFKLVITVALLTLVFRSVDLATIKNNLARLDAVHIVLLLCAYWAAQMATAQRWCLLARSLGIGDSYGSFLQLYFAGMFFGIGVTAIGGDIIRAQGAARRAGASFGLGLASVVLDRCSGLIALLVFGTVAILFHPLRWRGFPLWVIYAFGWVVVAILVALVRRSKETFAAGMGPRLIGVRQALASMRFSGKEMVAIVALSSINAALVLVIVQELCEATGHALDLLSICSVVPITELLTMLPVSISGLGIREWAYTEFLGLFSFPKESALSVSLALSALVLVRNLAGAFFAGAVSDSPRPDGERQR